MKVKIKKLKETAIVPSYKTKGAAACDLYCDLENEEMGLAPRSTTLVPTNLAIELPNGTAALVLPRSGLSMKTPLRISNSPGLIDCDYRGNIGILVDNISDQWYTIKNHERLAQLMIIKVNQVQFEETENLSETDRGTGGFGSTGTK